MFLSLFLHWRTTWDEQVDGRNTQASKSAIFPSTVSMLRTESVAALFNTCGVYVVSVLLPLTHRRVVRIGKALVYSLPHEDPGIIFERAFDNLVIVLLQVLRHLRRKSKGEQRSTKTLQQCAFCLRSFPRVIFRLKHTLLSGVYRSRSFLL